jgi:amidase
MAVTSKTGEPILNSMSNTDIADAPLYARGGSGISTFELFQVQKKRAALRKEYLDYWNSTKDLTNTGRLVDAIISPVAPFPPPPHGKNT